MRMLLIYASSLLIIALPAAGQSAPAPSASELTHRAEGGDGQAQFELGRAYEDGKGVPPDDDRAAEWFRKSANQGNAQAQNSLGVMYALGRGVQRDKEEAVRWYKKAAKQGLPEAIYNVAISYYNGEGVGENLTAAYAWMALAQDTGDAQANEALLRIAGELKSNLVPSKFQLALMYEAGEDIPRDPAKAMVLYREIAAGDAEFRNGVAQFKLCQIYGEGRGVSRDFSQARSWCKQAAKQGNSSSYLVLGRMAEQGLGATKDLREAAEWYENAAIANLREGYMLSGELKLKSGAHDDQKSAYYWFYMAQKLKIPGADAKLQEASSGLTDKEIADQQKKAAKWLHAPYREKAKKLKR